jgi:hypothetical protein
MVKKWEFRKIGLLKATLGQVYTLYPVLGRTFITPASVVHLTVPVLLGSLPNAHALQIHIEI